MTDTILRRPTAPRTSDDAAHRVDPGPEPAALAVLARLALQHPGLIRGVRARAAVESLRGALDAALSDCIDRILHHPDWQALEASWRGLLRLVEAADGAADIRIRALSISRRELGRTLRKYRGTGWDQSPIFRLIYEQEYGQLGGTPYGLLLGDYEFAHHPEDVQCLAELAQVAAAAHAPFVAGTAPALFGMTRWTELSNPRDPVRLLDTPEYAAWRALREAEDSRYLALCLPRVLGRLPYGAGTDPADRLAYEEQAEGADADAFLWCNAAWAFGAVVVQAFARHGWCARIRGVDSGGLVEFLPGLRFREADGGSDRRCVAEIALSERREGELSRAGLIPLVCRKNSDRAAFISAQSLQRPRDYDDLDATANAAIAARLPYLLASCRFAHYLKCMVRDKVGSQWTGEQLQEWLGQWLIGYVDGSPATSDEDWKAAHPLEEGAVTVEPRPGVPGQYDAKFFLRPHYQLEGLSVALRLVSRLPSS